MSRNLRYRYTVKVLTPLHIGSGETIPDIAYHVSQPDSPSYFWTLLDLDAAAVEWSRQSGSTDFSVNTVAEFARKHRGPYRKYTLPVSSSVARILRQSDNRRQRIWEQIKLNGKPYLPGSSLKGAIRTAVLGAFLSQGKRRAFEEAVRRSLKDNRIPSPTPFRRMPHCRYWNLERLLSKARAPNTWLRSKWMWITSPAYLPRALCMEPLPWPTAWH